MSACGDSNGHAPENLYLVAGDPSLELQVQTINNIAVQNVPAEAWRNVHSWVIDLQTAAARHLGECAFFIDCNPSFSAYTAQAGTGRRAACGALHGRRFVCPRIHNVGQLVYGHGVPPEYRAANFQARARLFSMTLPKLHVVALNRSTTYRPEARQGNCEDVRQYPQPRASAGEGVARERLRAVEKMFIEIPDAHTVAIVASHLGIPIGQLTAGQYTLEDDLEGERAQLTQVNGETLERYQDSIHDLIGRCDRSRASDCPIRPIDYPFVSG